MMPPDCLSIIHLLQDKVIFLLIVTVVFGIFIVSPGLSCNDLVKIKEL